MNDVTQVQLSDVFVEMADTLVDDFDVLDFLHVLADRCVQLLGVSAAGLLVTDQRDTLQVVAASSERTRLLELFQLQTDQGPAVDCFRTGQDVLDEGKIRIGQALADVATIGLLQQRAIHHRGMLTGQLQAALHSRVLIEQAKGVLAERFRIDVGEAFTLLRGNARRQHRRLSDLAQAIVDGSEQLTPERGGSKRSEGANYPAGE